MTKYPRAPRPPPPPRRRHTIHSPSNLGRHKITYCFPEARADAHNAHDPREREGERERVRSVPFLFIAMKGREARERARGGSGETGSPKATYQLRVVADPPARARPQECLLHSLIKRSEFGTTKAWTRSCVKRTPITSCGKGRGMNSRNLGPSLSPDHVLAV